MNIENIIVESTREIFSSMIMMEVSPVGGSQTENGGRSLRSSISGIVGLTGKYSGVLAIHAPELVARAITGNFLGMEVDEINEDVQDAIGELANMLAGNVKSYLSPGGKDIDLSIPSTVHGEEYSFLVEKGAEKMVMTFQASEHEFMVELQLRKEG